MPRPWILLASLPVLLTLCLHSSQARPLGQMPFFSRPSKSCPTVHFSRLVVHGDSFSDNGNVANELGARLENYAYGSATTDSEIVQGKTGINADLPVPGFIQQIQLFRNNQKTSSDNNLSATLFMISFQGNDFWFDPTIDTQVVLGSIERGVRQLVDLGSSMTDKVNIAFFDLFEFLEGFRSPDNLERLNITNVTHGCVSPDYQTRCEDAGGYFFYDSFHPSTKVHRAIGEAVLEFVL
ncbi:hypothetical protein BGZ74_011009 [Mortierella antarctica]|nr:hypothetical protein BGZ74_011009 [Mortierella antarctica]